MCIENYHFTNVFMYSCRLWNPDILLYNSASEFDNGYPVNIIVDYNGECRYNPPGIFQSTCLVSEVSKLIKIHIRNMLIFHTYQCKIMKCIIMINKRASINRNVIMNFGFSRNN